MPSPPPPPPAAKPAPGHRERAASAKPKPPRARAPKKKRTSEARSWSLPDPRDWIPQTAEDERALRVDALIIASGMASTLALLLGYWAIGAPDAMGMYKYMLPVGAFILGLLACSGYGIAGFFANGLRFRGWMLIGILASMFIAYWGIEYLHYYEHGFHSMGFFGSYDLHTQSMVWYSEFGESEPMGLSGYNYRFLEMVGIVAGGFGGVMIIPLMRAMGR